HPLDGSIVCMACERDSAVTPGMEPDTVRILQELQSSDRPLLEVVKFNDVVIRELKAVLEAHIEHCLGRQLKSAKYLE
ncbi:MAG: DNA repair protein RecO C-terminal domain-containing protein, partial [Deltaproteobacteria bacterium]